MAEEIGNLYLPVRGVAGLVFCGFQEDSLQVIGHFRGVGRGQHIQESGSCRTGVLPRGENWSVEMLG